ncbi:MAG: helix-hairpin-helix domain-containing protein [Promethearchaeota archaeon]
MTSQNIKELIDSIDEHNQTRAELEQSVTLLKNQIVSLNITIEDLKFELKNMKELGKFSDHLPDDVKMLKELVKTQREELNEKDRQIMESQNIVNKLANDFENMILNRRTTYNLSDIPGIGPKIEEKLKNLNISTIHDLMNAKVEKLISIPKIGLANVNKWKKFIHTRDKKIRNQYSSQH